MIISRFCFHFEYNLAIDYKLQIFQFVFVTNTVGI